MSNEIELKAISDMLKHSSKHSLQVECVWSLVWSIAGSAVDNDQINGNDIAEACAHALCEWDL